MIALDLKGIEYIPHRIELARQKNRSEYFLGINPRGLVPVLIHEGEVIIESNDILIYLEERFPSTRQLIPEGGQAKVNEILNIQDDYHLEIRVFTFRYTLPNKVVRMIAKSTLDKMDREDDGGITDVKGAGQGRNVQREFYEAVFKNGGVPDDWVFKSVEKIRTSLAPIEAEYIGNTFLINNEICFIDIALFCDVERLLKVGYPIEMEFPNMFKMYNKIKKEVSKDPSPFYTSIMLGILKAYNRLTNNRLVDSMASMD